MSCLCTDLMYRASTPLQNGPYRLSNGSSSHGRMPSSSHNGGAKVAGGRLAESLQKEAPMPVTSSHCETKDESSTMMSDPVIGEVEGKAEHKLVSATSVSTSCLPTVGGTALAPSAHMQLGTDSLEYKAETQPVASENPPMTKSGEVRKIQGSQTLTPSSADQGSFTTKGPSENESSSIGGACDPVKGIVKFA